MKKIIFILGLLFLNCISASAQNKNSFIIYNAHICTVNTTMQWVNAIVVENGKFVAVGEAKEILQKYAAIKTKLNFEGKYIYPGFIDAHCHFTGYALDNYKLNLYGTKSFNEIVEKIKKYNATNKRQWLEARQWNQEDWANKSFPIKYTLDNLYPNTPLFLLRIDGHAALCNQKALDIAGITKNTKIDGGSLEIKNNKLTGMLFDNAIKLVTSKIPAIDVNTAIAFFKKTEKEFYQNGITSFSDCMVENNWLHWLQKAYQNHKIQIGSALYLTNNSKNIYELLNQKPTKNKYKIAGIKVFADGSLGSRGAYLLQNYSDAESQNGHLTTPLTTIDSIAKILQNTNYQLCTHAIGDAANREVLHIYTKYLQPNNEKKWRIEHVQVINDSDINLFGKYKIIPSVQPTHATSDMFWAEKRLGKERIKTAYAYKKLLLENKWLPLGTDFPVEYLNPLYTFCAAVFRTPKNEEPEGGFQIQDALTREEALQGITIWAAKASKDDTIKGSIEVGKRADFTVLDINLLQAKPAEIYNASIKMTFIGGKKVYENK